MYIIHVLKINVIASSSTVLVSVVTVCRWSYSKHCSTHWCAGSILLIIGKLDILLFFWPWQLVRILIHCISSFRLQLKLHHRARLLIQQHQSCVITYSGTGSYTSYYLEVALSCGSLLHMHQHGDIYQPCMQQLHTTNMHIRSEDICDTICEKGPI